MVRILYIPSTMTGGVYYYRVYTPMKSLIEKHPDKFDIEINHSMIFCEADCEHAAEFDIIIVHNGLYTAEAQDRFWKMLVYCKSKGCRLVLDLDDYWDYGPQHPYNEVCRFNAFPDKMAVNLRLFDYVTTTTEWFKNIISRSFPKDRINVLPNAISSDDPQFTPEKDESGLIRIGMTGGSSHKTDIEQMMSVGRMLTEKQLDSMEFVLCGFDAGKGNERVTIDENGTIVGKEALPDEENWWIRTENRLKTQFPHYRRVESKSILDGEYGKVYKGIDVLLAPLTSTPFNSCKSELKFIEAGFTRTAVIASNVVPYSNYGVNGKDCLLAKKQDSKSWASCIKRILNQKGLLEELKININERERKERNLEDITEQRKDFLLSI